MFADRARIFVSAGAGGDGASSFRRDAHVPRGGPDGGDGGRGGSVILTVEPGMTSLGDFGRTRHYRAAPGGKGAGRRAHGRSATDLVLQVPPGTVVRSHPEGEWVGELMGADERLVVARGGRGGRGNVHFATATHRAPTHAEKGTPGDEGWIELELKLIADVGLVGAPNAGKSTLLAALTEARPEVGAYAFTTTSPNLGVVTLGEERTAVIADLPGLIEGANEGRGLGHHFLRHVERTRALVGVVDGGSTDPASEWASVAEELRLHDPKLAERPMTIVVTKMDLPVARERWPEVRNALRGAGSEALAVSAHDGTGLDELRIALASALDAAALRAEAQASDDEVRVHRFDPLAEGWEVVAEADGLRIRGRRIETTASRTNFENEESRDRFWRMLERLGVDAELRRAGAGPGTMVRIGRAELEWGDDE
ncbi:MAG: GTPase ObgE [Candidatus Limnocylindria bacterium]